MANRMLKYSRSLLTTCTGGQFRFNVDFIIHSTAFSMLSFSSHLVQVARLVKVLLNCTCWPGCSFQCWPGKKDCGIRVPYLGSACCPHHCIKSADLSPDKKIRLMGPRFVGPTLCTVLESSERKAKCIGLSHEVIGQGEDFYYHLHRNSLLCPRYDICSPIWVQK